MLNRYVRLGLFGLYLTVLFTLPVTLLGSYWGLVLGLLISILFLLSLSLGAEKKIFHLLKLTPLSVAEAPELQYTVKELSRRLQLQAPKIARLPSEALNIGVFGLRQKNCVLVLTDGLLKTAPREQLSALMARELTSIAFGDCMLSTWFSRFLSVLDLRLPITANPGKTLTAKSQYSILWLVKQMILLPLAIPPQYLLLGIRRNTNLDLNSLKISRLPRELEESYRLLEALAPRTSFKVPMSTCTLFLLPPTTTDPLSKFLFPESHFKQPKHSLKPQVTNL
jgi:Zn-dependent protease with chaperone function